MYAALPYRGGEERGVVVDSCGVRRGCDGEVGCGRLAGLAPEDAQEEGRGGFAVDGAVDWLEGHCCNVIWMLLELFNVWARSFTCEPRQRNLFRRTCTCTSNQVCLQCC